MKTLFGFFFLLILSACGSNTNDAKSPSSALQEWKTSQNKVRVLSTIAMIDDLVRGIGGDHVAAITLIQGELDPHSYQLVKGDGEKLAYADLIFYNGLGLEHGPSLQQYLKGDRQAIGLGNSIQMREPELILFCHGQPDPHIWMDVSLWMKTVPYIVEALSKKDPTHASEYAQNGEVVLLQLAEINKYIQEKLSEVPAEKRYLVTSHDAFSYFARAYLATPEEVVTDSWHERFQAPEGLAPDSQLCATDIQDILDHLALHDIHVLFPETNVSKDSIRKILSAGKEKGLGLRISTPPLYGDAMGKPGSDGDTYIKMMQHNAAAISKELNIDTHSE